MSLEGQQIGRYRLVRLLGSGGMGEVYLATDSRINRQVAIKVIRTDTSPYPNSNAAKEAARLFQREVKAISGLDHPHTLPLFDYGEENLNGTPLTYMVMPYRSEGSLATWLRQRNQPEPLSPQDVAHFISQAADALQYAHDHQIIHQDVKPSNFLIRNNQDQPHRPDLLLADFGVAKFISTTASSSQSIRGTPTYMAPEQWRGHPCPATDQYALAVMAYELLTGRPPFQGSLGQVMYAHSQTPPPPPGTLNPRLSSDIDAVLLRALAKQPEERFASISAFAHALQQASLSDRPPIAQTTETAQQDVFRTTRTTSNIEIPKEPSSAFSVKSGEKIPVPRRGISSSIAILLVALALLAIAGSVGSFYFTTTAQYTAHINATATAQAQVNTPATAQVQATVRAQANATATAVALQSPYGGTLALNDPLRDNSQGHDWGQGYAAQCTFSDGVLHVPVMPAVGPDYRSCIAANTNFSNFAYQVQMTITKGDGGGIIFRSNSSGSQLYYFRVGQDGSYDLNLSTGQAPDKKVQSGSSSAIRTGLNQSNVIAVVAGGSAINLYVNHRLIASVNDGTYSQGAIGVFAFDNGHPQSNIVSTEAVFSNAKVWTL